MSFHYSFATLGDARELRMLINFMATQDLGYPGYHERWLPKTEAQLERGEKQAIIAFSERTLVGNLVHQSCRDTGLGSLIEIKNLRIHPELRERYFANFMMKQLYVEARNKGDDGVIVDVRANQQNTRRFFESQGFVSLMSVPLYETAMQEVVMFKPLKQDAGSLIPKTKEVIMLRAV